MAMKFFERTKFYHNMLLLNRRNTLILLLGLGISLAIISEGLIFMYSFQYNAFIEFNREIPTIQLTVTTSGTDVRENQDEFFPLFEELIDRAITNVDINTSILRTDWIGEKNSMLYIDSKNNPGNGQLIIYSNFYSIPDDYFGAFEEILYNGTMPHRIDETVVVAPRKVVESSNLTKLGIFPLYVPVWETEEDIYYAARLGIPLAGAYVNVTGVILSEDFENYNGKLKFDMACLDEHFTESFLITKRKNVMRYTSKLQDFRVGRGHMSFTCRFSFDLEKIDAFNIRGEVSKLNNLGQEISREFAKEGYDVQINSQIVEDLLDFKEEFTIFQLISILFIIPIIGMALSLSNYTTNLMKKKQKRQISNMLQRGSSRKEILSLLITQVLEFTIAALLLCILIGYPFASLILKSNGFLNFSGTSIFPAINMIIFYVLIGATVIFSIVINSRNIWNMANITTQEAYGLKRDKKPFWQRTFIDIILIIIGIAFWLVVKFTIDGSSNIAFAYGFGTTAPVCLIFGSILLIARIYPYFINLLAKIGWKREKFGILGLSAKRSIRRKNYVIRSLILVSITFTLIISSITTISSYQQFDSEQAYYQLGADILIRNTRVDNDNVKERVLGIEGVEAGTYIKFTSQVTSFGSVVYSYLMIGVNPEEFTEVAYIDRSYINTNDKSGYFGALEQDNSTIMQKNQMDMLSLKKGDKFQISIEKTIVGMVNYSLNIGNTFDYFPRFYVQDPQIGSSVFRFTMIVNYSMIDELAYSKFTSNGDMLVAVKPGYSISAVAEEIEQELDRSVENVESLMKAFEGSLRNTMLYGSLNTLFLSSIVITLAAISLMIFIQTIENEMELNLLKTIGMSPKQLFSMFTIEALTLVAFGSIFGICVGLFSAKMFLEVLTVDNIIPPERMMFQGGQIVIAFVVLFLAAITAAAVTSWVIFRKDTIKGIKAI
ncbi:MAG: FtsX-like permease family protein [Asgard group archaeon]|nr:FtsX-like permease family protein [Asgard group archaeon]